MQKRCRQAAKALGIAPLFLLAVNGQEAVPTRPDKQAPAPQQAPLPSPWQLHQEAARQSNYLPRYLAMVRLDKEYRASEEANSYLQARGTVASVLGDLREANRLFDEAYGAGRGVPQPRAASPLEGYTPRNAESVLLKAANQNRVLMINEGHHQPQTRVLTTRLLRRLYDKGFRYLALEALNASVPVSPMARRRYPTADTGAYTNESVFGDTVRQALEIGYTLVPYEFDGKERPNETMIGRMNRREIEQARNLKERVFDKDPHAKLLVHAGMGHVNEQPQLIRGEKEPWVFMAIRFKEMTGIDPFTVDQQTMISRSRPEAEPPVYRDAVRRGWVSDRAVVFVDTGGKSWTRPDGVMRVNAQVFLPPVRFVKGRPDWMARDLGRVAYSVPESLRQSSSGLRLIQAFFDGEPGNAVPVDQILLRPDEEIPVLMLPRRKGGRFWLRVWDETGKVAGTTKVKL